MLCKENKQLGTTPIRGVHACVLFHGQEQWVHHVLRLTEDSSSYRERVAVLVPEDNLEYIEQAIQSYVPATGHVECGIVEDLFASWGELNLELCSSRLEKALARCAAEGFDGLKIIVDMSWLASRGLASEQVECCIEQIDSIIRKNRLSVFAGFDRQLFSSRRLLSILPLYPSVWMNGSLSDNVYHTDVKSGEGPSKPHEAMLDYVLSQFDVDSGKLGRSEIEGALRMLKQIIDSMGDGVIVTDTEGNMRLFNRMATEIIGFGHSELPLEQRVRAFGNYMPDKKTPFPIEDLPISKAIRGESVDQVEIYIKNEKRPEGVWVSGTGRPLRDSDGVLRGGVVVFRDISEKKRDQAVREQLESRMMQTQKLESLGLLAGEVAHDFNNLLMAIMGHAGLALEFASKENRERIESIQKTAVHLSALTNQLLDFAGQGTFVSKAVDIEKLVCELCGLIRPIVSKRASVELDFSEEALVVLADPTQLRQIVMNLVTNASDALSGGQGTIRISTKRRTVCADELRRAFLQEHLSPGEFVSIRIQDTGIGIDPEKLKRIFDPFFTTKSTGRGLGLAAVLGLVRRHGGALLVESEVGLGTSFEVLLPPCSQEPELEQSSPHSRHVSKPGTVLIIDDEQLVRSVAQQILEHAGYSVKTACSGREGMEIFAREGDSIDAVLLDVSMPDMDGREVCVEMKQRRPNTQIVLSSGYTENELIERFPTREIAGFLQKPYSPEKLVTLLQQLATIPSEPSPGESSD